MSLPDDVFAGLLKAIDAVPVRQRLRVCSCGTVTRFPVPPPHIAAKIAGRVLVVADGTDYYKGIHTCQHGCYTVKPDQTNGHGAGWVLNPDGSRTEVPDTLGALTEAVGAPPGKLHSHAVLLVVPDIEDLDYAGSDIEWKDATL